MAATITHPRFKDVRDCLTKQHGCTWGREPFFKNDDVTLGKFRRTTSDAREVFSVADYDDDAELEPELVQQICRSLEIEISSVHITNRDGEVISVKPPPTPPPPPPSY